MFTTLSSYVGRIRYAEVIDVALCIEASQMEKKAFRVANKKPKLWGSFLGGSGSSRGFDYQSPQRNTEDSATSSGLSPMSISTSRSYARGVSNPGVQGSRQTG